MPAMAQASAKPEKLSKQCATFWSQLKGDDVREHNNMIKIHLLSPFLFGKVYQTEKWIEWAKKSGILNQKRTGAIDELSEEEITNSDLVEQALLELQKEITAHRNPKNNLIQFLEDIIDSIEECIQLDFYQVLDHLTNKKWYTSVRKKLDDFDTCKPKSPMKYDCAVVLATWQVCEYLKMIHSGEKPLEKYKENSSLDEVSEKKKSVGNDYFKKMEYSNALSEYTSILVSKPYIYVIYGNRAACYLKRKEYRSALSDGRRVTTLNPHWEKGQYRYATALLELGKKDTAIKVLKEATRICDNISDVKELLQKHEQGSSVNLRNEMEEERKKESSNRDYEMDEDGNKDAQIEESVNNERDVSDTDSDCDDVPSLSSVSDDSSECEDDFRKIPGLVHETESSDEGFSGLGFRVFTIQKPKPKVPRQSKFIEKKKEEINYSRNEEDFPKRILSPKQLLNRDVVTYMKEGTHALLENRGRNAVQEYRKAITIINEQPDLILQQEETLILRYAYATSYLKAGSAHKRNLKKIHKPKDMELTESLNIFTEINKTFAAAKFPLPYLGIGKVFVKQNRFDCLKRPLEQALEISNSPDCMTMCTWPGVDTIIEDSIPKKFKATVEDLLALCAYPPPADAVCRYIGCQQIKAYIYFSDPDFKGFIRFACSEKCVLEYHMACWKKYKCQFTNKSTEKEFARERCFTPDCFGIICTIHLFATPNGIPKELVKEDLHKHSKSSHVVKSKRIHPTSTRKHIKLQKRLDRKESLGEESTPDLIEELEEIIKMNEDAATEKKVLENSSNKSNPADLFLANTTAEMVVLKKDEDIPVQTTKVRKPKHRKQKTKVHIDVPFLDSSYKKEEKTEKTSTQETFQIPPGLQQQYETFEEEWQHGESRIQPHIIDNENSIVDGFDFMQFSKVVPEPKNTALHVFSMFEQILEAKGCANVKNSPDVTEFLNILDDNSKRLIESVGGFRVFLTKCTRFFFDNRNPNVVYLTSQKDYYETCDMVEGPFLDEKAKERHHGNLKSDVSSFMPQTSPDESLSEDSNDVESENNIKLKENIDKESVIQEEKKEEKKTSIETLDTDSTEKEPAKIRLPKYRGTDADRVFQGLREIAEKSGLAEVMDSDEEERTRPSKTYMGHETKDCPFRLLLPEYINKHDTIPFMHNDPEFSDKFGAKKTVADDKEKNPDKGLIDAIKKTFDIEINQPLNLSEKLNSGKIASDEPNMKQNECGKSSAKGDTNVQANKIEGASSKANVEEEANPKANAMEDAIKEVNVKRQTKVVNDIGVADGKTNIKEDDGSKCVQENKNEKINSKEDANEKNKKKVTSKETIPKEKTTEKTNKKEENTKKPISKGGLNGKANTKEESNGKANAKEETTGQKIVKEVLESNKNKRLIIGKLEPGKAKNKNRSSSDDDSISDVEKLGLNENFKILESAGFVFQCADCSDDDITKMKCTECDLIVLDNYLCPCVSQDLYELIKKSKPSCCLKPSNNNIKLSTPPHKKNRKVYTIDLRKDKDGKQALKEILENHATPKNRTNKNAAKPKEKTAKRIVESSRDKEVKTSKSKELKEKSIKQKERSGSKGVIESPKEIKTSKLEESTEKKSSVIQATSAKITNKKESSEKSAKQKEKNNIKGITESQSDKTATVSKLDESVEKKSSVTQANSASNDTILGSMQQSTKGTGKLKSLEKQTTVNQNKVKLATDKSSSDQKCLKVDKLSDSNKTPNKMPENEKEGGSIQKSSEEKQQKQSAVVNQDNHIKDTTADNLPLCVVEVGIQADTYKEEREDYIHKSDVLMSTNKKLIEEVKQGKVYRGKYEDLLDEVQKQKAKFNTATAQFKQDIKEQKAIIEKEKRESTSLQQTLLSDIKKLNQEKKDLHNQIKQLNRKIENSKEEELMEELDTKNSEYGELQRELESAKMEHAQEKNNQEEIIKGLLSNVASQRQRAEKVEITLLDVKKNFVASAYQQKALQIQNIITQMQFAPQTPEVEKARETWENYKKDYQTSYEKMQEEFAAYSQQIMKGTRLEEIPPSRYAEPPPLPPLPTMGLNANPLNFVMQQPNIPRVLGGNNLRAEENVNSPSRVDEARGSDTDINNRVNNLDDISLTNPPNPKVTEHREPVNLNDKMLIRLGITFPNLTKDELEASISEFKQSENYVNIQTSKFEDVVSKIEYFIRSVKLSKTNQNTTNNANANGHAEARRTPKKQPLPQNGNVPIKQRRMKANQVPKGAQWTGSPNSRKKKSAMFGVEEPCVICYEDMVKDSFQKLLCGHVFHKSCITSWLKEQRTCPVCRVHALLPDEYPALGN